MNISFKPVSVFLKKYNALIPPIAIIAVSLLLFIPVMMLGGSVKKSMAASAAMAGEVQSELDNVPSKNAPEVVKSYMDKLEEDASRIDALALQCGLRDLITYDYVIFPKPTDPSAQIFQEFGRKYRTAIEEILTNLKAKDAPSQAEILSATGSRAGTMAGFSGQPGVNSQEPMVDALCIRRSKEISVYAHPTAFGWYSFWEKYQYQGEDQALQDCWNAQVSFWIYQDVADTIGKLNGENSTVDTSAVKRLLGMSFSGPVVQQDNNSGFMAGGFSRNYMGGGLTTNDGRDIPNYVTTTLFSNFVEFSPTARKSNEETDIVHFALSVVVDNRKALEFMKELCSEKVHRYHENFEASGKVIENARHNQISILESSIKAVDTQSPQHDLYRYGKGAAMQLDLVCEYQFYKKSYDSLKPAPIRTYLGMADPTSDASTGL